MNESLGPEALTMTRKLDDSSHRCSGSYQIGHQELEATCDLFREAYRYIVLTDPMLIAGNYMGFISELHGDDIWPALGSTSGTPRHRSAYRCDCCARERL